MSQPFANSWQTHPAVDEFSCVRVPKLVKRAGNTCLGAVMIPSFLHRLVAQWSSSSILFRSKQRPMFVAHPFQVGSELLHQMRIIEQDRSPLTTFPHDCQMFIVEREIEILHIEGESLTDSQAGFQEQTEEEAVTQMLGGNGFENPFNLVALHATGLRRIEFHPVDLAHRIAIEQILLLGPGQKARDCCLLARSGCWAKMGMHSEELPQHLCRNCLH